jgi:hypothetical protein
MKQNSMKTVKGNSLAVADRNLDTCGVGTIPLGAAVAFGRIGIGHIVKKKDCAKFKFDRNFAFTNLSQFVFLMSTIFYIVLNCFKSSFKLSTILLALILSFGKKKISNEIIRGII